MYVNPKQASKQYNVSEQSLRCWAASGKIQFTTTKGGHRRYLLPETTIKPEIAEIKIIYSRVSSKKQSGDMEHQSDYLRARYPDYHLVSDIGSGLNYKRTGFKTILEGVFNGTIKEVVVTHRDRFCRFGFELFEWIFEVHNAKLICCDTEETSVQHELTEDIMSILTVFTARYYGKRKYKEKNRLL